MFKCPDGPKGFCLDLKLTYILSQFDMFPPLKCSLPVLDMFAGVGDPILPADHMVNRPKLAATHLALNFTISPGISSSHHPKYSETPTIYGYYLKSLVLN